MPREPGVRMWRLWRKGVGGNVWPSACGVLLAAGDPEVNVVRGGEAGG
jgi:hypothetical protein